MIFGTDVQKIYLGNQEVNKILFQGIEVFNSTSLNLTAFDDSLLAYWSFDASSFQPTVGNYTAVVDGGAWTITAGSIYGLGATLAPNQRIRVAQNLWNVKTNPLSYTVSFWVRKNVNHTVGQEAVMLGSFFGNMGFVFMNQLLNGSFLNDAFSFTLATGNSYQYKAAEVQIVGNLGAWRHITGTYDLPNQIAKLYIDGTLVATTTQVLNNNCTNDGWSGFAMNGSVVSNNSSEYGNNYTFDMVGFWARTLTDNEVRQLYNNYDIINDFIVS